MNRTVKLLSVLTVLLSVSIAVTLSASAHARSLSADTVVNAVSDNAVEADAETLPKDNSLYPKKYVSRPPSKGPITRLWGIPDTEALVGHAFSLTIPKEAFQGPVMSYSVDGLPPWLQYLNDTFTLVGVPPRQALGTHVYVSVTALGASDPLKKAIPQLSSSKSESHHFHGKTKAHDTFAITVLRRHGRVSGCGPTDPLTKLTLTLARPWDEVSPVSKVETIRAFAQLSGLSPNAISLVPAQIPSEVGQSSEGMELMVTVGCAGTVLHEAAVSKVTVLDYAAVSEVLSMPVVDRQLVTAHDSASTESKRPVKRSAQYGGSYNGDYNYEYEYEYDDYDPSESLDEDVDEPEERVVPSLATPVFTNTPTTATVSPGGEDPLLPPVLRPVPISTPVFVPLKPTRVVVEASPTLATPSQQIPSQVTVQPTRPTPPSSSVVPTRPLPPAVTPQSATPTNSLPTTTPSTPIEVTDHMVRNFPPKVARRVDKIAWVAGFVYRFRIPEDTFEDLEDGNTRNLRLVLLDRGQTNLGPQSWVQFDPVTQEIYALPLEDHTGHWTYMLEAIDSGGKSIQESIKIHIHQPKEARNYAHRYTAIMRTAKKYEYDFAFSLDWQISVVHKIAALFDNSTDSINIRAISESPTKVSWTNVTIVDPLSTTCPEQHIQYMNDILFGDGQEQDVARNVIEAFKPEFHLKKIHVHYSSQCEYLNNRIAPPERTNVEESSATVSPPKNKEPQFVNQVDIVRTTAGVMFRQQVPPDACYDFEDGNARNMRMRLLTNNLNRLPLDFWLQFDTNNQEFYGLPLDSDVGSAEFTLECVDKNGGKTSDSLEVVVEPSPLKGENVPQPPALFSVRFDHDYSNFMSQPYLKALMMKRLGTAFRDSDERFVSVTELAPGSVVVSWHNSSLPSDGPCPDATIRELRNIMFSQDNVISAEFADHFLPEFVLEDASITPTGACLSPDTPRHIPDPDVGSEDIFGFDDLDQGVTDGKPKQDDYLLTFLIPSILMAAMLILAAIAACCLYRHRRRYAKMSLTNHATPPDTTTFVTTGIPVILAEELDDPTMASRGPSAKNPVIMKDEKPPLPPYRQSPPTNHRHSEQPYQQPPPPFTNGRNSPRNTQPPAYRKPTYMPP